MSNYLGSYPIFQQNITNDPSSELGPHFLPGKNGTRKNNEVFSQEQIFLSVLSISENVKN